MLARSSDEVVDVDGLWDWFGACCRQAIKDFEAGPSAVGDRHYQTACQFLERSGLMDRISALPAHASGPRQLGVFDHEQRH